MAKTTLKQHTVKKLLADIDAYVTANPGVTAIEIQEARRDLQSYPHKNADQSPREFTEQDIIIGTDGTLTPDAYAKRSAALAAAFEAAKKAFALVSTHTRATAHPSAKKARDIKAALEKIQLSRISLTPEEYASLKDKTFDAIDLRFLTNDAQVTRSRIAKAITAIKTHGSPPDDADGIHYTGHYDGELLVQVEDMLASDATGKMLVEHAKKEQLPIIFAEHDANPQTVEKGQLSLGFMVSHDEPKGKIFYFIAAFINRVQDASVHAITIAHELRHFRFKSLISQKELYKMEPQDYIIACLLDETDAQAVYRKVAWMMYNKGKPVGAHMFATTGFEHYYNLPLYSALPPHLRLQRATQDCFIDFISRELERPLYIKKYVEDLVEHDIPIGTAIRKTGESNLLGEAFMTRLSQMSENVSYLDPQSIRRIRSMLDQKLPALVTRLETELIAAKAARDRKAQP